ncbi:MAG: hypothetical protein ONB46_05595 [candidate division KSB1 bacterium]|nr:hypothetical protein [candidate division KSB1 bacterium]MDZ7365421.1 hypothetical protein [candidate division KSB1 bacterium]MDZ7403532.1 hypothetical protein [candidate division KSB1 bacterium]
MIPPGVLQDFENAGFFHLGQTAFMVFPIRLFYGVDQSLWLRDRRREIVGLDHFIVRQGHRVFDGMIKLADISRPINK